MQVCFHCGAANSPEAKVCHSCSASLGGAEEEEVTEDSDVDEVIHEVECPNCGYPIGVNVHTCPNCQFVIYSQDPIDRPAPKTHERDITDRYDQFAERVQMIRDGRMSVEQFGNWLRTTQQMLLGQRERYVEMIKVSGYYEDSTDEVNMGMTGILDYEEAMEMMLSFAGGEADSATLDAALEKMWEGNEKCNEAARINRRFRAQLEEDWGYM